MTIAPEPFTVWTDGRGMPGYLHGTKADLKAGALIEAGRASNYGERTNAVFVYLTATLDAATWGAELAMGDGRGRIYIVEPTGPIEDDPARSARATRFGSSASSPNGKGTRPSS